MPTVITSQAWNQAWFEREPSKPTMPTAERWCKPQSWERLAKIMQRVSFGNRNLEVAATHEVASRILGHEE